MDVQDITVLRLWSPVIPNNLSIFRELKITLWQYNFKPAIFDHDLITHHCFLYGDWAVSIYVGVVLTLDSNTRPRSFFEASGTVPKNIHFRWLRRSFLTAISHYTFAAQIWIRCRTLIDTFEIDKVRRVLYPMYCRLYGRRDHCCPLLASNKCSSKFIVVVAYLLKLLKKIVPRTHRKFYEPIVFAFDKILHLPISGPT